MHFTSVPKCPFLIVSPPSVCWYGEQAKHAVWPGPTVPDPEEVLRKLWSRHGQPWDHEHRPQPEPHLPQGKHWFTLLSATDFYIRGHMWVQPSQKHLYLLSRQHSWVKCCFWPGAHFILHIVLLILRLICPKFHVSICDIINLSWRPSWPVTASTPGSITICVLPVLTIHRHDLYCLSQDFTPLPLFSQSWMIYIHQPSLLIHLPAHFG